MLQIGLVVALLSFAAGAASSFLITDWWNGISYSSAVSKEVDKLKKKQLASESILKAQLAEARKTHIKYRTIRSRANEINVYSPCLNDVQLGLWNEATAAANSTEADKPDGTMRKASRCYQKQSQIQCYRITSITWKRTSNALIAKLVW